MARWAVAAATWFALAALIAACVLRGWTDLTMFGPRQWLAPTKPTPFPDPVTLALMRDPLQKTVSLEPGNPQARELLARWYELSVWRFAQKNELAITYREQGLVHLRAAAVRKPGSPQVWARIAEIKQKLGALDAEFDTAMVNAAHFGPWEPEVHVPLADIALTSFEQLSPAARAAAEQAIANGLLHSGALIFDHAARLRRLPVLCSFAATRLSPLAQRCR